MLVMNGIFLANLNAVVWSFVHFGNVHGILKVILILGTWLCMLKLPINIVY